jgi:ACS family hexuronate transporter-like MFS transporter
MMKRGFSANAARKLTMLACAFLVMPIFFAQYVDNLWLAVGDRRARHGGAPGLFRQSLHHPVGHVPARRGRVGDRHRRHGRRDRRHGDGVVHRLHPADDGSYTLIFAVAGSVYLIAIGVVHLLSPRLARVQ